MDDKKLVPSVPLDLQKYGQGQASKGKVDLISDTIMGILRDNYKLEDCTTFLKIGTLAATGIEASIVSFTMPNGMTGVLKAFGHDAKTTDAFLHSTWRIFKNGSPLSDFGNITTQLGAIASPMPMTERLYDGDIIEVRNVTDGGAYEVYAMISGWYWSTL